ncbi:type III effector HrpK [Burkholderia glumae]|nr:type III effector HrpK [Burkholderia glumae]PJO22768.1 type III effector HrpK [Burkholderia glumae AU6208]QGA40000.1 type III effector HrpK [Burkholderia glumae]QHE14050.1 type III effector HrpK [Burkholderia glumae AU6208]RQZ71798.1 type III effector HrpK [Burkholderia glumae]
MRVSFFEFFSSVPMTSLSTLPFSPPVAAPSMTGVADPSSSLQAGMQQLEQIDSQLQQMVRALMSSAQQQEAGGNSGSSDATPSSSLAMPQTAAATLPQEGATGAGAGAASGAATDDGKYAALDSYSQANDQSDLAKWADLAPPDQGASLERPLAAMQILSGKAGPDGQPPSDAQKAAAMQFVNDNPSLKTALQNTGALKSDGTIDTKKMNAFMGQVSTNLDQADSDIKDYMKKHPDADADSVNVERSAGLLKAYNAIAGESEGHKSNGKNGHNYTHGGKSGGGLTTQKQIEDLQKDAGFSASLKAAAQAFGSDGGFDDLDRSGDDKATSKRDQVYSTKNLDHFLHDDAPTTQAGSQQFLQDASLQNITGNTDISQLNGDVIQNPQNYTPQQKAAVMVKLMETLVDVQAGGSDKLRKVDKTVAALQQDIQKLASDPDTAAYLQQTVPPEMQQMSGEFQQAGGVGTAGSGAADGTGGTTAAGGSGQSAGQTLDDVHRGLSDAKTVTDTLSDLAKGDGFMGLGGDSAAAEAAGAAAASGGAEGAAEGAAVGAEAAEGAAAGVEGGAAAAEGVAGAVGGALAAAAPVMAVGAAVVGVAGIVFAIVEAVKKHNDQKKFASNVNPTLQQFGIPLPS